MSTAEDVFYLYERNSSWYHNCKNINNIFECKYNISCCECHKDKQLVMPITLGNRDVLCDLSRRCYVKPGTECSICFESIERKTDAYLTCCGHAFHKRCIFSAFKQKVQGKWTSNFGCPLCRRRQGFELYDINRRYYLSHKECNSLDILEDFWQRNEYMIPELCLNGHNHNLGFKDDCKLCLRYRETGQLI